MKLFGIGTLIFFFAAAGFAQTSAGVGGDETIPAVPIEITAAPSDTERSDRRAQDETTVLLDIASENNSALPTSQTRNEHTRPEPKKRFRNYLNGMFGPMALAQRAAQSGVGTWRNSPEEWGGSWEGFGRRFASGTGKSLIKNSAMYGLDEVLKVDSRFYRSEKRDAGSRIRNALISPFQARRPDGSRTVGVPRLVGTYTSNIVAAETWYPARYNWKDGVKSGTISLGFTMGFNLIKEFIWKK